MSWNGSGEGKEVEKRGGGGQRRDKHSSVHLISPPPTKFNYKALVAGLVVVIGGGIAAWVMMRGEKVERVAAGESSKPSQIAEIAPQIVTNAPGAGTAEEQAAAKPTPYWKSSSTNGLSETQILKWKAYHRAPPCYTNITSLTEEMPKYHIFNHASENRIAAYLTIEPGQGMVGTPCFGKPFADDFLKSCEEPIVIGEEDDEFTRNLKKQMRETKIEIMNRIRDGEKLEDIMNDTHREIQRLAAVKHEISTMLHEEIRGAASEEEADDMIAAANKMLEAKGVAPIKMTPVIKRSLMRSILKNNDTKRRTR